FALSYAEQTSTVGLVAPGDSFPSRPQLTGRVWTWDDLPGAAATLIGLGSDPVPAGLLALYVDERGRDYPPLVHKDVIPRLYFDDKTTPALLKVRYLKEEDAKSALKEREVDIVLRASNDFWRQLEQGRNAEITVDFDESEEAGRLARNRLNVVLGKWK